MALTMLGRFAGLTSSLILIGAMGAVYGWNGASPARAAARALWPAAFLYPIRIITMFDGWDPVAPVARFLDRPDWDWLSIALTAALLWLTAAFSCVVVRDWRHRHRGGVKL